MIKIAIVDDHELLLDGLKNIFSRNPDYKIRTYSRTEKFRNQLEDGYTPDLLITDIKMPEETGIELITDIHYDRPNIKVLVMSMLMGDDLLAVLLDLGIKGYFVKGGDAESMLKAVETIVSGGTYFSEEVRLSVSKYNSGDSDMLLSAREMEIVTLLKKGQTTTQIASELFISTYTVQTHRRNIFRKLEVHNTAELLYKLTVKNLI